MRAAKQRPSRYPSISKHLSCSSGNSPLVWRNGGDCRSYTAAEATQSEPSGVTRRASPELEPGADDPRLVLGIDTGRWVTLVVDVQRHRQIEEIADLITHARARLGEEIVAATQVRRDLMVVVRLEVDAFEVVREAVFPVRDRARLGDAGQRFVEGAETELERHGAVVKVPDVSTETGADDRPIVELLDGVGLVARDRAQEPLVREEPVVIVGQEILVLRLNAGGFLVGNEQRRDMAVIADLDFRIGRDARDRAVGI